MKQLSSMAKIMFTIVSVLILITVGLGVATAIRDGKAAKAAKQNEEIEAGKNEVITPSPEVTPEPEGPALPGPARVIAVDAGKRINEGALSSTGGLAEYQLNLLVAQQLEKVLVKRGFEVIMLRSTNEDTSTEQERVEKAIEKSADIFLSIQCDNYNTASPNGIYEQISEVQEKTEYSEFLAKQIHKQLIASTKAYSRSLNKTSASEYKYLTNAPMPALIVRIGYLSNPDEDAKLQTEEYRQKIADGITEGIIQYFKKVIE